MDLFWLRKELKEAFAADDEAKRDFEQWQAKHALVQHKKYAGEGLVFKTFELQSPMQSTTTMDPVIAETWDRWAEAHINKALAEQPVFSEAQVAVMGEVVSQLRKQLRAEFAIEIAKLRSSVNKIIEGGRDAAA
jgi:hypothetical protein